VGPAYIVRNERTVAGKALEERTPQKCKIKVSKSGQKLKKNANELETIR
jgi:hypothetical protein